MYCIVRLLVKVKETDALAAFNWHVCVYVTLKLCEACFHRQVGCFFTERLLTICFVLFQFNFNCSHLHQKIEFHLCFYRACKCMQCERGGA